MIIHSERMVTEQGIIDACMRVENGIITDITDESQINVKADIDYGNATVIPGIFDTHNHGMMGWYPHGGAKAKEDILGYCKALASVGITSIFPTCTDDEWQGIIDASKEEIDGAAILGIHSEGPYLNRVGEKGVDIGHPDIDLNHVSSMVNNGQGLLKLVALAPELPKTAEAIHYFTSHGIRCAFAHSNANYAQAEESFKQGITVITHTANVMSGIHHRNMGGLGAALLDDSVYNELICDGLHVCNEMIELMFRVKKDAFHKFMMISDNIPMAGFPAGTYQGPFGRTNVTNEGFCLSDTGRLSGSAKPVVYGMKNLVTKMNLPLEVVCRMSSLNPCEVYGFADHKGSLRIGKDADFAVIDDDFNVLYTWRMGKMIFDYNTDTDLINHVTYDNLKITD